MALSIENLLLSLPLIFLFCFQKLQDRLKQLLAGQNDTTRKLNQSLESVDKLQTDVRKKTEQIEKFQRDVSYKDDRIRNLEIRGIIPYIRCIPLDVSVISRKLEVHSIIFLS